MPKWVAPVLEKDIVCSYGKSIRSSLENRISVANLCEHFKYCAGTSSLYYIYYPDEDLVVTGTSVA